VSFVEKKRPMMSLGPPGENGMIHRIGRDGNG